MPSEKFVITAIVGALIANDPAGRKKKFYNRFSSCYILPLQGKIRFSYRGGEVIAAAGQPVFLPQGLTYTNECLQEAKSYVFNLQTLHSHAPMQLAPVADALCLRCYEAVCAAMLTPTQQNELLAFEILYALSRELLDTGEPAEQLHPIVQKATAFMQHAAQAALTVADIARHCHISEIWLRKLFDRELHVTPHRHLTALRMKKASLLIEEKRPLKEIAAAVGYADVFQFSRAYKRYFGYAPTKRR